MSGTSADGIDVAICRISPGLKGGLPRLKVLAHRAFPYAAEVRGAVLAAMNAQQTSTAELARLSWRLGELYADAVAETIQRTDLKPQLVAVHGQTLFHETSAGRLPRRHRALHLADRRARRHRRAPASARHQRLPHRRPRRRRPGCAARAHARPLPVPPRDKEPHPAQPRRHRQPHRPARKLQRQTLSSPSTPAPPTWSSTAAWSASPAARTTAAAR